MGSALSIDDEVASASRSASGASEADSGDDAFVEVTSDERHSIPCDFVCGGPAECLAINRSAKSPNKRYFDVDMATPPGGWRPGLLVRVIPRANRATRPRLEPTDEQWTVDDVLFSGEQNGDLMVPYKQSARVDVLPTEPAALPSAFRDKWKDAYATTLAHFVCASVDVSTFSATVRTTGTANKVMNTTIAGLKGTLVYVRKVWYACTEEDIDLSGSYLGPLAPESVRRAYNFGSRGCYPNTQAHVPPRVTLDLSCIRVFRETTDSPWSVVREEPPYNVSQLLCGE